MFSYDDISDSNWSLPSWSELLAQTEESASETQAAPATTCLATHATPAVAGSSDVAVPAPHSVVTVAVPAPAPPEHADRKNTRARAYCFTANVAQFRDPIDLKQSISVLESDPRFKYLCFQQEVAPSTGQRHYQGYVQFGNAIHFTTAKQLLLAVYGVNVHLEIAKGSAKSNMAYCSKPGGSNFTELGDKPLQGKRSDLADVTDMVMKGTSLRDIALEYPTDFVKFHNGIKALQAQTQSAPRDPNVQPVVHWWFGPTGSGKSQRAYTTFGMAAYTKMDGQWWDGYMGEDVVILDDYRTNLCPFNYLLRMLDRYPMRVQTKGSSIELSATTFVITTTSRPEALWNSRTEEAINQLLRRITYIEEFVDYEKRIVHKEPGMCYIPIIVPYENPVASFKFPTF